MSLDKSIKYCKEHRKQYMGAQSVDPTCRPNGGCHICANDRLFSLKRERFRKQDELVEWNNTLLNDQREDPLDLDLEKEIFGEDS